MRWEDRVYGAVAIREPEILDVIRCPTFERLKGVHQAGPSSLAFPFKNVTRYEHSLGVFLLLERLGAARREQIAGLLHDISHTAFSHAVDFLVSSEEQDHHEQLKPLMLGRADLVAALSRLGYAAKDFYDDSIYPLLEQPLPWLCADRLDYFLRDGLACGVVTPEAAARIMDHIDVRNNRIVMTATAVAREAAALFAAMNRDWWASPTEAFIYNEFADALREGMRLGALRTEDLLTDDATVLARLESCGSPLVARKLRTVRHFRPELLRGYAPRIVPKERWLDPLVLVSGKVERLSVRDGRGGAG
jgi:HD superfamily phosphohydrolase